MPNPTQNLEYLSYECGKIVGGGVDGEISQIHGIPPVSRFTKRKFPFLATKCPIHHKILNISLIFLENLLGTGWMEKFSKSTSSPLCSLYGPKGVLMAFGDFPLHFSLSFFNILKEDIQG